MEYEELLYMIAKGADVARETIGAPALCVTSYNPYALLDERDIDNLKFAIGRDALMNRSLILDSLGCIDSGLL